jgi:tetratricopeptide (TPR) repeat protein
MEHYKKLYQANLLLENEQYDEALGYLYEIASKTDDLDIYFRIGMVYYEKNELAKAEKTFLDIVSKNPTYANSYYGLGIVAEERKEIQIAINYYLEAINYDPDFDSAYYYLACLYDDANEIEKAKEGYLEAIRINPDHFWANVNLGAIYEKEQKYDKALVYTKHAYEIDSTRKFVAFNLGVINDRLKDYDEAKKYYQEEIEKEDGYPYGYLNLAILYKDVYQDLSKARKIYLEGIAKHPEIATLWYNLGCTDYLMGLEKEAVRDFDRSFELDANLKSFFKTDPELVNFSYQKQKV